MDEQGNKIDPGEKSRPGAIIDSLAGREGALGGRILGQWEGVASAGGKRGVFLYSAGYTISPMLAIQGFIVWKWTALNTFALLALSSYQDLPLQYHLLSPNANPRFGSLLTALLECLENLRMRFCSVADIMDHDGDDDTGFETSAQELKQILPKAVFRRLEPVAGGYWRLHRQGPNEYQAVYSMRSDNLVFPIASLSVSTVTSLAEVYGSFHVHRSRSRRSFPIIQKKKTLLTFQSER